MSSFTKLESAVLNAIFAETPEWVPILEQQFGMAAVTKRENTGHGFFTTIEVHRDALPVNGPRVLGCATYARVEGLMSGLGFVLFLENGRLHLLDGYALGGDSTTLLNLEALTFSIEKTP